MNNTCYSSYVQLYVRMYVCMYMSLLVGHIQLAFYNWSYTEQTSILGGCHQYVNAQKFLGPCITYQLRNLKHYTKAVKYTYTYTRSYDIAQRQYRVRAHFTHELTHLLDRAMTIIWLTQVSCTLSSNVYWVYYVYAQCSQLARCFRLECIHWMTLDGDIDIE